MNKAYTFKKEDKVKHRFRKNMYQQCVVTGIEDGCNGLVTVFCEDDFYGKPAVSTFPPQDLILLTNQLG